MRTTVLVATMSSALLTGACGNRGEPLSRTAFVPPGLFLARTICGSGWFDRACELVLAPPEGKNRSRVRVWLGAFWADTDPVTDAEYEVCRAASACPAAAPIAPPTDECGHRKLAVVSFEGARAYCQWRGWRLPTADEYERMARWTDGRRYAAGVSGRKCSRRTSPDGIRSLNLDDHWVAVPGHAGLMGGDASIYFREVDAGNDDAAIFRCVRAVVSSSEPGRAKIVADQSGTWLRGDATGRL